MTNTQAKIYIGSNALSVASASEIAYLSEVRREEVYSDAGTSWRAELRHVEMLPFNPLIVDEEEAIRGEFQSRNTGSKIFLANDQTQIGLVRMSFNSLWELSQKVDESLDLFVGGKQTSAASESERGARI